MSSFPDKHDKQYYKDCMEWTHCPFCNKKFVTSGTWNKFNREVHVIFSIFSQIQSYLVLFSLIQSYLVLFSLIQSYLVLFSLIQSYLAIFSHQPRSTFSAQRLINTGNSRIWAPLNTQKKSVLRALANVPFSLF